MKTEVITPRELFKQPQQLAVPLFQRSYAWKQAEQWAPLWRDVVRVAERALQSRHPTTPHFLGAVVHQQLGNPTGYIQEWTVIDGQQRLTTLQLLLDAIYGELQAVGASDPAKRVRNLVENEPEYRERDQDRFKVWPTNKDRAAFRSVMESDFPMDYEALEHKASRIVQAHRFFATEAKHWLDSAGPKTVANRANALERAVSELIQMVVIRLEPAENAQEIFETLNARGAQLTAADLIKNFVFQRLLESGSDVEAIYKTHWEQFETPFWEAEISLGRYRHLRSSAFLYHWLVARTDSAEPLLAGQVFDRFKEYADEDTEAKMGELVAQIHRASNIYRDITWSLPGKPDPLNRLDLFAYRVSVLQSEVVKPVLLFLLDPEATPLPDNQLTKALDALESWLVRRTLVRAGTKSHTKVFVDLMNVARSSKRDEVGDTIQTWLAAQSSEEARWPDDAEVKSALRGFPIYRRLSRGRLRMVLEAVEDYQRGFRTGKKPLAEGRVPRGTLSIEHILPQKWQQSTWPLRRGETETSRQTLIHTLGNLTLVTHPLNATMKRAAWTGAKGKRDALKVNSVLKLNSEILSTTRTTWTEDSITARTDRIITAIIHIWPAPAGHHVKVEHEKTATMHGLSFADFLEAGIVAAGDTLYPIPKKWAGAFATVMSDGRIDVTGLPYDTPGEAARAINGGRAANGWTFFRLDADGSQSLRGAWLAFQEEEDGELDLPEDGEEEDVI